MKNAIITLLLVLAALFAAKIFFEQQNAKLVYEFCTELAKGNPAKRIDETLYQFQERQTPLQRMMPDENNPRSIWVTRESMAGLTPYFCQISIDNGKISELLFSEGTARNSN